MSGFVASEVWEGGSILFLTCLHVNCFNTSLCIERCMVYDVEQTSAWIRAFVCAEVCVCICVCVCVEVCDGKCDGMYAGVRMSECAASYL